MNRFRFTSFLLQNIINQTKESMETKVEAIDDLTQNEWTNQNVKILASTMPEDGKTINLTINATALLQYDSNTVKLLFSLIMILEILII